MMANCLADVGGTPNAKPTHLLSTPAELIGKPRFILFSDILLPRNKELLAPPVASSPHTLEAKEAAARQAAQEFRGKAVSLAQKIGSWCCLERDVGDSLFQSHDDDDLFLTKVLGAYAPIAPLEKRREWLTNTDRSVERNRLAWQQMRADRCLVRRVGGNINQAVARPH